MEEKKKIVVKKRQLSEGQLSDIRAAQSRMAERRIEKKDYGTRHTFWSKLAIAVVVLFFIALKIGLKLYKHYN